MIPRVARVVPIIAMLCVAGSGAFLPRAGAEPSADASDDATARLARSLSTLIRDAIPRDYERHKDWGATKEIAVGLRTEGRGLDISLHRRKKAVNHGVWKHYKVRLVEPEKNLAVELTDLRPLAAGRMGFTLRVDLAVDAWARAKVYQYGVHVVALEVEGDARLSILIEGEIGLEATLANGSPGVAVRPKASAARLSLHEFHLRRVSNARGPLVRELGDELGKVIEDEINGPQLVEKLNRGIEKQRDRLVFSADGLIGSPWRPLASR